MPYMFGELCYWLRSQQTQLSLQWGHRWLSNFCGPLELDGDLSIFHPSPLAKVGKIEDLGSLDLVIDQSQWVLTTQHAPFLLSFIDDY